MKSIKNNFLGLKELSQVYINMNLWRFFDDYASIKHAMVVLPLLKNCKIETESKQKEIEELEKLVKIKEK